MTTMQWEKVKPAALGTAVCATVYLMTLYLFDLERFFFAVFLRFEDGPVAEVDLFCPCCCNFNCSGSASTN